jgi:transposase
VSSSLSTPQPPDPLDAVPRYAGISLSPLSRGLTVRDVARRYRVGEDKVRGWIRRGELAAVNTASALCGKPRWVVLPDALAEFEKLRSTAPPAKPSRRRRRHELVDFYPD